MSTKSLEEEKLRNQRAMVEGINSLIKRHKTVQEAAEALPVDKSSGQFKRLKDALSKMQLELEKSKNE